MQSRDHLFPARIDHLAWANQIYWYSFTEMEVEEKAPSRIKFGYSYLEVTARLQHFVITTSATADRPTSCFKPSTKCLG
jgi:hypothetical protein